MLEIIKNNWVIIIIIIVIIITGLLNFKKKITLPKTVSKPVRKSAVLPSIFEETEDLADKLDSEGFLKSAIEARSLLTTIINEYPEIK